MTNFVLTGLPDFIIIGEPWQHSRPRPGGEPVHVESDFAEVLRLLGARRDGAALADRVAYSEAGEAALRRVLDRFGFEQRPDTFGELYGLFDYCDRLIAISGIGVVHPDELTAWQARSFLLVSSRQRPTLQAARLFCLGDLRGLRAAHREGDTLRRIGLAYRHVA